LREALAELVGVSMFGVVVDSSLYRQQKAAEARARAALDRETDDE
jgi:hypothetical protein